MNILIYIVFSNVFSRIKLRNLIGFWYIEYLEITSTLILYEIGVYLTDGV